jgi:cell division protein FtsW (lipid II flippase)
LNARNTPLTPSQIQGRLILLAAVFIILYSATLALSPAALLRSWNAGYRWSHWIGTISWLVLFYLAHHFTIRRLPHADPYLLPVALLLGSWGTLSIWRILPYFGMRQTVWSIVAVAVYLVGLYLPGDLSYLRRYKYVWLSSGLLLIALTFLFGTNPSGSGPRLWLGCCGVYLQPSEPLKVLLLIYLAAYLAGMTLHGYESPSDRESPPKTESPLLPLIAPTLLMTGIALLLLIIQRDLGTASIFLLLFTTMIYLATSEKRVLLLGAGALALAAVIGYIQFDVVRLRVEAWINPWLDPIGRSYQIVQSLIAIANGGMLGRGPGLGAPSLVPIAHSDFIYTAIIEEGGLLGAVGLLILMGLFAQRGLRLALRAPDAFRRYLAAGVTIYLVAQSLLIIGGNTRLLPLTGVTLPFVSYGGSSLLTAFIGLLILMHISNQSTGNPLTDSETRPYRQITAFLLFGLGMAALGTGWWAYQRSPSLLARTDNPRRSISDRYVKRGSILDRNNEIINSSDGNPGSYSRSTNYPSLSPIVGYTHPVYGQAGIEASQDGYLRGLRGNPSLLIWWNHILYGQPPPGLDLRTTLDLNLQSRVDQALEGHAGAAVLLNAETGEILAMSSQPGFDANQLDNTWESLVQDKQSPLLNRATQGRYPAETLFERLFSEGVEVFGFDQVLLPSLPDGSAPVVDEHTPTLSPLQAAVGAATLSEGGVRPIPALINAVNTPTAGWVLLPAEGDAVQAVSPEIAAKRLSKLKVPGENFWESAVSSEVDGQGVSWFLGGTTPDSGSPPIALALVLEEANPELARELGRQILEASFP